MRTTRRSRWDEVVAAMVALAVNGWLAWQLHALLSPQPAAMVVEAEPLQVVLVAAVPRRAVVVAVARRHAATGNPSPVVARALEARARPEVAPPEPPADLTPARPMTAVYVQQAGQWAAQHPQETLPDDPFANRHVPLASQSRSRFRLSRPITTADALAKIGRLFAGDGYTTDDCAAIRGRVVGLVAGGDAAAAQQDLDYERRYCRP